MTQITLIQCTDSKRSKTAPARDLYDESRYFRRMRAWANALDQPYYILSAKHELVEPSEQIAPYDERGLTEEQAESIAEDLTGLGVGSVDVTAGRDYTDPLIPALERHGIDVVNHFAGRGIGKREQLLREATAELVNETL